MNFTEFDNFYNTFISIIKQLNLNKEKHHMVKFYLLVKPKEVGINTK